MFLLHFWLTTNDPALATQFCSAVCFCCNACIVAGWYILSELSEQVNSVAALWYEVGLTIP